QGEDKVQRYAVMTPQRMEDFLAHKPIDSRTRGIEVAACAHNQDCPRLVCTKVDEDKPDRHLNALEGLHIFASSRPREDFEAWLANVGARGGEAGLPKNEVFALLKDPPKLRGKNLTGISDDAWNKQFGPVLRSMSKK